MGKRLRLVSIGCASGFGRGELADVLGSPEFDEFDTELVLVDLDPVGLDRMLKFGERLKEHFGSTVKLSATTDRLQALPGADYVITSVAIKRYPLWEQDYRAPMAFGFKHCLGENGGPGAVFHALRNYQLMVPLAEDMERLCPEALLLNFTNPESRIIMAVSKLTRVSSVGLCHGMMGGREGVSRILGRPLNELDIIAGGLNHFFWVTVIRDKATEEDLYPAFRAKMADPDCPAMPPLVRKMVEVFGCYTYPSDDHIGEYLSFATDFTGQLWHYGQEWRPVPLTPPEPEPSELEACASRAKPVDEHLARKSGELAIPIILGIECDLGNWECAVNVPNTKGYVANLDLDGVVEVPAVMDAGGVHPQPIGPLPEGLAAFCNLQIAIQKLLVEAYREKSKRLLLQTLLLDPVVDSAPRAEQLLDYMLELQKDYLPEFR